MRFADFKLKVDVKIEDLQTAIKNENPNVTESDDELSDRLSIWNTFFI